MKFPFTAALGAEDAACTLNLTGISPEINDVLAQDKEGTAEFTMVRTLTDAVHSGPRAEGVT